MDFEKQLGDFYKKMNTVKNNSVMKKTMNEKMGMYRQKKRDDEERKKKEEEEKALEGK